MKNIEVAELLNEIADYLEFEEEPFKVRAYRKAALTIESLSEDIEQVWKDKKLIELPGIGEGIAKKIDDFVAPFAMTSATAGILVKNSMILLGLFDVAKISMSPIVSFILLVEPAILTLTISLILFK